MDRKPVILPKVMALSLSLGLIGAACGSSEELRAPSPGGGQAAEITSFAAEPDRLEKPGITTVSWRTLNATSIALSKNGEEIGLDGVDAAAGSLEVEVTRTSTLELVAHGEEGAPATASLIVTVVEEGGEAQLPTIASFAATKVVGVDEDGEAHAVLSWAGVVGADELFIKAQGRAPISIEPASFVEGSVEVALQEDTEFTLVARNEAGEVHAIASVRVVGLPVIETFAADRSLVGTAESVEVNWTTSHAYRVELWVNGVEVDEVVPDLVDGAHRVSVVFPSTIELRAFNEVEAQVEASLEIDVGEPVVGSFEVSTHSLWLGETLELSWETEGGSELSITAGPAGSPNCDSRELERIRAGSCEWTPAAVGVYELELRVSNGSGIVASEAQVLVGAGPAIVSFTMSPEELDVGGEVLVVWSTLPDPVGEEATVVLEDGKGGTYPLDGPGGETQLTLTTEPGHYEFTLVASTSHPLSTPVTAHAELRLHGIPEVSLVAEPSHFDEDTAPEVSLTWTSAHAKSLVLYRLDGEERTELLNVPEEERAAGSHGIVPLNDSTYLLVAANGRGTERTAQVEVSVEPPAVLSLTADVDEIIAGEPVNLSWDTKMAEELSLNIFDGSYVVEERNERYIDVEAVGGTHLPLGDECGADWATEGCAELQFPQGFSFPFGDEDRHSVVVYSNGFLSFDPWTRAANSATNRRFPTEDEADGYAHMAVFWDGLGWDEERFPRGNIHWIHREDPVEGDHLVIQWKGVGFYREIHRQVDLNFEVILWANGDFEYRYDKMDPDVANATWVEGASATIGYQLPDQSDAHVRNFNQNVRLRGTIVGRSLLYRVTPELSKSGTYLWHPYSATDTATVTLLAKRGELKDTKSLTVDVKRRPELYLPVEPPAQTPTHENFRVSWETILSSKLEVLDEAGAVRCITENPESVAEGFCHVMEEEEGVYRYTLRASTSSGFSVERTVTVIAYDHFGIDRFEADTLTLEHGRPLTLSWETSRAPSIRLFGNGEEIELGEVHLEAGQIVIEGLSEDTIFVLRVENQLGVTFEESLTVELWNIRLEVSASASELRPGDPLTIDLEALGVGDTPDPRVYGTFPMTEIENPSFSTITSRGGASRLGVSNEGNGYGTVDFSGGFTFPYFGVEQSQMRVFVDGYVSFDSRATYSIRNEHLPDSSTAQNMNVHIAPFWDDLHFRSVGELWGIQEDPDTYIIEWAKISVQRGSSTTVLYDLNFQLVLKRDGTFEFHYGTMAPPAPPATSTSCAPETCVNEANGSSATIGYQSIDNSTGSTLHFGGYLNDESNPPFPGGLANRAFRYSPRVGSSKVEFNPVGTQSYVYCSHYGKELVCKSVEVQAEFGIDSFEASLESIDFGGTTRLSWKTHGGTKLVIRGGEDDYVTEDFATIDEGYLDVTPTSNTAYELVLLAKGNEEIAVQEVEVTRMTLTATAPTSSFPGQSVPVAWQLTKKDPNLEPVVLAPMEEVSSLPFSELDLTGQEGVEVLFAEGVDLGIKVLEFDEDFRFNYLGKEMSEVRVATEGYLSFDPGATSATSSNQELPRDHATYRRVHIAPFWEDLHTRTSGRVLAKRVNEDSYVIQWSRTSVKKGSSDDAEYDLNFMVVLHRRGDFEFRFGNMHEPSFPVAGCAHETCFEEANGSSATIGYQYPTGTLGYEVHYDGNAIALQKPVPQGLTGRSWKFTRTGVSGVAQVHPWDTKLFEICALDPATEDVVCAEPVEVEVEWGVYAFDAQPWAVMRGEDVTLSWEAIGLDDLSLKAVSESGTEEDLGAGLSLVGSIEHRPSEDTTYILEGTSLGRTVSVERVAQIRKLSLDFEGPAKRFFPGEQATITWNTTQHEPGDVTMMGPMVEVAAGQGDPGAYQDISGLTGAMKLERSGTAGAGYTTLDLPFSFPYFGGNYGTIQVYIDGYISFSPTTASGRGTNVPLPGTAAADQRIHLAPFWDDMWARGSDAIWVYAPPGEDPDTFVIQWTNFNRSQGSNASNLYDLNFQVHLHRDGTFEYRYGKMQAPEAPVGTTCYPTSCVLEANGSSATIGYATVDGSFGYNIHFGGNGEGNTVEFVGGLENRTFVMDGATSGSTTVRLSQARDYTICALVDGFTECKTIEVQAIAEPGDLMITELMIDPGSSGTQWFEVRNLTREAIDLEGFVISTREGEHRIDEAVQLEPNGFVTLAAGAVAGFTPDYVFGPQLELDKLADTLSLRAGSATIGTLTWGVGWRIPTGATLSLDPVFHKTGTLSNDDFERWCQGTSAGTPGALGAGCLNPHYDVDPNSPIEFFDISGVGQRLRGAEGRWVVTELPTNFSMPFFGTRTRTVWVASNGWISFSPTEPTGISLEPPTLTALPREYDQPQSPLVAAFWDWLECDRLVWDCRVYTYETMQNGQDVLIVQWNDFRRATQEGSLTFQVQLYEDGDVVVAFGDVIPGPDLNATQRGYYQGTAAWIALEGPGNVQYTTGHLRAPLELDHRTFHYTRKE